MNAADPRSPHNVPEGLYVHLPFCAAICTYCDFASELYASARARVYLEALENEFRVQIPALGGKRFAPRTIFLGGGTPSALNIEELKRFFDLLDRYVERSRLEEFTIEANPGSTEVAKLEFLRSRGVDRISFGVQSFQPHLLKLLGRIHGADQGREAVTLARAAGFSNYSIDLMHGLPTQSVDDLRRDLDEALKLETPHVSAYGLIYEDGTPLKGAVEKGVVKRLSPENESEHYHIVMEAFERGGLPQYEISNYARPGFEARHNLIYWRNEAYLGVGVSAASYIAGERRTNFYEMDRYMPAAQSRGAATESTETLDPAARAREALVLALRLRTGVNCAEFERDWGLNPERDIPRWNDLLRAGVLEPSGSTVRIARASMHVADGVMAELL